MHHDSALKHLQLQARAHHVSRWQGTVQVVPVGRGEIATAAFLECLSWTLLPQRSLLCCLSLCYIHLFFSPLLFLDGGQVLLCPLTVFSLHNSCARHWIVF